MRIEVRCTKCGNSFLIDEHEVGGDLTCPGCSAPMQEPASPPAAKAPAASVGRAAAATASSPVQQAAPAVAVRAEEVVCPRCQLHFVPRRATAAAPSGQRRTVLVVEDMDYFREIAQESLAARYEVKTAANVNEARAALSAGGIDLMVLDLTLDGGEHGVELLRTMVSKPCPIVIYTAQDESEMYGDSWDELQRLGADDLVMKGMNVGESLLRKVASLLGENPDDQE
jgi:CheY-like chemotaxis protein